MKQLLNLVRKKKNIFFQDKLEGFSLFKEENHNLWKIHPHILDSFHILNSLEQLRCLGKQPRTSVLAKFSLLSFKILGFLYMGCNTWKSYSFNKKKDCFVLFLKWIIWSFNLYPVTSSPWKYSNHCWQFRLGTHGGRRWYSSFCFLSPIPVLWICPTLWQQKLTDGTWIPMGGGVWSYQGNVFLLFVSYIADMTPLMGSFKRGWILPKQEME